MENIIKIISGFVGGAASFIWGGFPLLLEVLFVLMVVDFLTGVLAGWATKKLSSKIGRQGIARKILIPVLVGVAHFADLVLNAGNVFRDAVVIFYTVNEIISILENAGRAGLPIPEKLKQAIEILQQKGGKKK